MKRILFSLFLSLIFISFVSFSFANEEASSSGDTTSSGANKSVEYTLPYPGLLADSPLYFLKVTRDRLIEFFIADPVKKADFYLLQADKRLYEGSLLFDKGNSKYSMAESVVSKGENYFEKGIAQIHLAKKQNLPVDSLIQKYRLSSLKHEEVIKGMMSKSTGDVKGRLSHTQERVHQIREKLNEFKPQS